MRAVVVQFDRGSDTYSRLLKALINSWRKNSKIPLEIHTIQPPKQQTRFYGFDANHAKLRKWVECIQGDTILIDADMLCLKDISHGFDLINHIGITDREGPIPYNGGVVFVKDTEEAKDFMQKWLEIDARMMSDAKFHRPYHKKYAGMNQSSLGWLMENGYAQYATVLPSSFNCVEPWSDWKDAMLLHVKGVLRRNVFRNYPKKELEPICEKWREYARQD